MPTVTAFEVRVPIGNNGLAHEVLFWRTWLCHQWSVDFPSDEYRLPI